MASSSASLVGGGYSGSFIQLESWSGLGSAGTLGHWAFLCVFIIVGCLFLHVVSPHGPSCSVAWLSRISLRLRPGTSPQLLLPHYVGESKSQGQPKFKAGGLDRGVVLGVTFPWEPLTSRLARKLLVLVSRELADGKGLILHLRMTRVSLNHSWDSLISFSCPLDVST